MLNISIGSDHGGFLAKEEIKKYLANKKYNVIDVGCNSLDSCDYPEYAKKAAELVSNGSCNFGIVICTSGEGVMIVSNKIKGIRCGLAYNDEVASLLRKHNDANMIAFGAKFTSIEDMKKRIDIFLNTPFEGGRHKIRVDLIKEVEK